MRKDCSDRKDRNELFARLKKPLFRPYACSIANQPSNSKTVAVREEPIELCQLLKFAGLTDTGGEAKYVISEGLVLLNGVVETRKRKKVMAGDQVTYADQTIVVQVG